MKKLVLIVINEQHKLLPEQEKILKEKYEATHYFKIRHTSKERATQWKNYIHPS